MSSSQMTKPNDRIVGEANVGRLVARRTINSAGSCANSPVDDEFGYDARGLLVAAHNNAAGLIWEHEAEQLSGPRCAMGNAREDPR